MLERHKNHPQEVINYINTQITTGTLITEALEIMADEARAEGYKEGQKAGQPRCQKVNTEYCKCNCGKHKENGDY